MNADASNLQPALLETEVKSFVIDSREIKAGDCFFALSQPEYKENGFNGDFEDSTKYVVSAFEKGAVVAVVRKDRFDEHNLEQFRDKILFVNDAIFALQRLAHGFYLEWSKPVVAVTGSAGKTTAKELTAHVLSRKGLRVLKNIKNYNNGLGHPLTVLRLAEDKNFDAAVLEMGMSTPLQEIKRLCRITPPDFAVALNVLPVHVEHLGSIERVAEAKAELIEGMKPDGTAILNADDHRVLAMSEKSRRKTFDLRNRERSRHLRRRNRNKTIRRNAFSADFAERFGKGRVFVKRKTQHFKRARGFGSRVLFWNDSAGNRRCAENRRTAAATR